MFRFSISLLAILGMAVGLTFQACKKDENKNALPIVSASLTVNVIPSMTAHFSYYSFERGEEVPRAQKNTVTWDFGLQSAVFLTNSGIGGLGQGGAQLLKNTIFNELHEAPENGYRVEEQGHPTGNGPAITSMAGEWYHFNQVTNIFSPVENVVFVFKTAEGMYVKMKIDNIESLDPDGNPITNNVFPSKLKYDFRYVYQPNGSRKFK